MKCRAPVRGVLHTSCEEHVAHASFEGYVTRTQGPSPGGATQLSPALQRWERGELKTKSRRDGRTPSVASAAPQRSPSVDITPLSFTVDIRPFLAQAKSSGGPVPSYAGRIGRQPEVSPPTNHGRRATISLARCAFSFYFYCMELDAWEKTVFALDPISRTVPTTNTRITASMTAYSAMS